MNTVREWFLLLGYLFEHASAVKSLGNHVYTFLFFDFDRFDEFREAAYPVVFPYAYSTTIVDEYEITVNVLELCRRIPAELGTPFVKFPKRK